MMQCKLTSSRSIGYNSLKDYILILGILTYFTVANSEETGFDNAADVPGDGFERWGVRKGSLYFET